MRDVMSDDIRETEGNAWAGTLEEAIELVQFRAGGWGARDRASLALKFICAAASPSLQPAPTAPACNFGVAGCRYTHSCDPSRATHSPKTAAPQLSVPAEPRRDVCTCFHAPEQHDTTNGCAVWTIMNGPCPCEYDGLSLAAPTAGTAPPETKEKL